VFVTQPQTPVDETGKKVFDLTPDPRAENANEESKSAKSGATEQESRSSKGSASGREGSLFEGEPLIDDLARDEKTESTGSDDFDHLNDRSMVSTSSSISSSMVEVSSPSEVRDSMLADIRNQYENDEKEVGDDGSSSSSSSDGEEKPLSECHVEDEEEKDSGSGNRGDGGDDRGFIAKYWCTLLFSPLVISTLLTVVGRTMAAK